MSMCLNIEYDEDGNDIWKDVKFTAPPEGFKAPPSKEVDKKVQAILARIRTQSNSS